MQQRPDEHQAWSKVVRTAKASVAIGKNGSVRLVTATFAPASNCVSIIFFVTLQAIVDGMGLGVGTFPTLSAARDAGRICTPFARRFVPGSTYLSIVPLDSDKPNHLREFQAWLTQCAVKSTDEFKTLHSDLSPFSTNPELGKCLPDPVKIGVQKSVRNATMMMHDLLMLTS